MSLAFLFPGQGSQAVGMGAELADAFASARAVFEEVDDALGQGLSRLMREGPAEADPRRSSGRCPGCLGNGTVNERTCRECDGWGFAKDAPPAAAGGKP